MCSCIAFRPQYTLKKCICGGFNGRLIVKSVLSTKETFQVVFEDLTRYRHSGFRTLSKSTDLTFSPRGKMVVLYYVLSGWIHIFEKLENAALCPYLQCLLDCRRRCFLLWSMVALLGSSDLCFFGVCLPFRLPGWLR